MRVLIFTHHYLDDNSGGSFASRAYINAFTEIADTCMLMYPDRGIPIGEYIHKKCILKGVKNKRSNILKVIDYYRGRMHRYMDVMIPVINEFNPDVVVFDNSRTSAGMITEVKKMGVKTITIHHNYELEYYEGTKPNILWRIPFMHYMEKAERAAIQESDLNLTLTDEDTGLLQMHYDPQNASRIARLGCFESVPRISGTIKEEQSKIKKTISGLCFAITGTLGTYQTEVSVLPFLENEYHILLDKFPDCKLIIAGRNPSGKLLNACAEYPSIDLIANPKNMQEIMNLADVYICPTCVGGGLKLRVMDGLKSGLPVLTHVVSARGYDDFSKANCMFVYDDRETFGSCLDKLINEMKEGKLEAGAIKNLYKKVFSFESGVERLKEILNQNGMI
ncbi:MAG: glycosyltransferase [Paludibacter sp.]|nr:glycosyltransferase [Paludibacter sp.]